MELRLSLSAIVHAQSVLADCAEDAEGTSADAQVSAVGSLQGAGLSASASSAAEGVAQARKTYSGRLVGHGGAVAQAAGMLMDTDEQVAQGTGGGSRPALLR